MSRKPRALAPAPIRRLLRDSFFGQLATVDRAGRARVTTVRFFYVPERDALAFATHKRSPKWRRLRSDPRFSGCVYDPRTRTQLSWHGHARLVGSGPLLAKRWRLLHPDVRRAYWNRPGVSPDMCLVLCRPSLWDRFHLHPSVYARSTRVLYRRAGGAWRARRLGTLDGRPLKTRGVAHTLSERDRRRR